MWKKKICQILNYIWRRWSKSQTKYLNISNKLGKILRLFDLFDDLGFSVHNFICHHVLDFNFCHVFLRVIWKSYSCNKLNKGKISLKLAAYNYKNGILQNDLSSFLFIFFRFCYPLIIFLKFKAKVRLV